MAAYQGLKRLNNGVVRRLTKSEADRGYIFITNDKEAKKLLGKKFDVKISGEILEGKSIDSSGRIMVGRETITKLNNRDFSIKLIEHNLIIK